MELEIDKSMTVEQLLAENKELRLRLNEANNLIDAIRDGGVDALLIPDKNAEQVYILQGADHMYREIVEEMQEGYITLSIDGVILYSNPVFAQLVENSQEKVIGITIYELLSPEEGEIFQRFLTSKDRFRCEFVLKAANGKSVPVLISANCCTGEEFFAYMIITDLTELKRSEKRFMYRIFDQAAEAIIVCDVTGAIFRANKVATDLFGADILGSFFDQAISFLCKNRGAPFLLQATQGGNISGLEASYTQSDGKILTFLISAGMLTGSEPGETIGYLVTLADITERKRILDALIVSEMRYRMLFENVNDAIFLLEIDRAGNPVSFREANELATRRLGYTREEFMDMLPIDIHPEPLKNDWPEIIHKLQVDTSATLETIHLAKDGRLIPVEVSARYFIEDGVPYILAAARDLSERKRAEAILERVYARHRRNDLLNEMVKGNQLTKQKTYEAMCRAGIKVGEAYSCFYLAIDKWHGKPREYWQKYFEELRSLQETIVEALDDDGTWVPWVNSEGIGVLHFGAIDSLEVKEKQLEMAEVLRLHVEDLVPGVTLLIGIPEIGETITDLGVRFRQSCTAVRMGCKIWPERRIFHYLDMGVFQLISCIEDQQDMEDYIERILGKLIRYDRKKDGEYLLTLELILESSNFNDVAKKVFVHQKTVIQRKKRIEQVLGVSLDNFETRMALATALKLNKLGFSKEQSKRLNG